MSAKPSFFAELQRRKVYKVGAMYAVGGWLLVQVATQVLPIFHVAEVAQRLIVLAIVAGFPVALVLAWIFDLTPQGIVRTDALPAGGETPAAAAQRRGFDRRLNFVLGALLLLALGYFAAERTGLVRVSGATQETLADKSIAVLPFTDLSPGHDQEYFSDGMAEELLNALAKVKDLKVAGRTSSFSFKGKNEDLRAIGQTLGVAAILEGSVRKQGNRVRITAQLIQTSNGYHLWSNTYDGELTDVFDLQEKIARAITQSLQAILEGGQQQRLVPVATGSPEAYALFLQATTTFNRRDGAHFPEAIAGLQEAIRLDPAFARAHARLASVYAIAPSITTLDRDELLASAEREAQAATALDPTLAEPWAALAMVRDQHRQFLAAREAFDRALALDPKDVTTNFWLATALITTGYERDGTARLDRVLELDPLLPNGLSWRGTRYLDAGEYTQAHATIQRAIDNGLTFGRYPLAMLEHAEGHDAEAIADLTLGARVMLVGLPDDSSRVFAEGFFGDAAARARALARIDAYLATRPPLISGAIPWALLYLGEPARALAVAAAAPTRNDALLLARLWSPSGKAMRALPEFPASARRLGFVELWDQYGPADACTRRAPGDYTCD